ncbi:MAG TPA: lytic transglycosylase domain-containing protein [Vicinamibacteria bacterium]
MPVSKKLVSIADVGDSPLEAESSEATKGSGSEAIPAEPEIRQIIVRQGSGWQTTALLFLSILLLTTVGVAFFAFHRVAELNDDMSTTMRRVEQKIQNLDAGISFDSKRQQLMLGIRDEIMRTNPRVSLSQAYDYATHILKASEKYPSIDPLMFLAIGIVESGFDSHATSEANAKGLYQIWPSTGRLLARSLNLEYSDAMLYDPETNTELAALYLDILLSAYNDQSLVLAEYNGGPLNAGYYRAGSSSTALETREYVQKVSAVYDELRTKFELGVEVSLMPMHKDRERAGKELAGETLARTAPAKTSEPAPVRLAGQ